jgi:hypothetical protein
LKSLGEASRLSLCKGPGAGRACVMEEQRGGRVAGAEGTRGTEGGGGREGTGRSCRVLWDAGRTWALSLREVGAMEGCGQGREGLAHGCPLMAAVGDR